MPKNRIILGLLVALALCIVIFLYRAYFAGDRLNVEPHAGQEIEKAKQR